MAILNFERFGLPNLHQNAPQGFFRSRAERILYVECLAEYLGIVLPDVDTTPWYSLTNVQFTRPRGSAYRAFGKGVLDKLCSSPEITRNFLAVLMDAYPDVGWEPWRLGESSIAKWTKQSIFVDGITLPSPSEDQSGDGELRHLTGRQVSRRYLRMVADLLGIEEENWEAGWNNISLSQIETALIEANRLSGWEQFLSTGCPERKSLFSALSTHFDDLDFDWCEWLVGGNVPDGWGNPDITEEDVARSQLRRFLTWYVQHQFGLVLEDDMGLLYDVGQRGLEEWHGVCKNHFNGSPQELVEFVFPDVEWDVTKFGLNRERQRFFYHVLRSTLTESELAQMDSQHRKGWEHRLNEFGRYPLMELSTGQTCGGSNSKAPSADAWFNSHQLMVDVLGEDHFDATLSRSNDRSPEDIASRFEQRQLQDRWRWQQCWNAGYKTIAIGPELPLNDEGVATYVAAIEQARSTDGPCFIAIGWPADVDIPTFEP